MRNFANYQVDIRHRTSGVIKTICNQCLPTRHNKRDRSLRVNIDTGHCHCYHCGADFYVPDDTEEREKAERQAARKRRAAAVVPQHFQRPVFDASKTTLSDATERWLVETRCIPQSVIAELRITEQEEFMPQFGAKERCVCFNYFEGGQLVNTKFRSGKKHFKMVQGAELIPYNIDSLIGQTSCIIHEGELDAASSIAAGFKGVISVPAGANSNLSWLDRFMETHFEDLEEIIIAVDTDSAGIRLRDELVNRLGAERCRVVAYGPDCKDANEHLVKYGLESLRIAIEQAVEVPLDGIFTAADLHGDLRALFDNGFGPGAETGWEEMDKICTYERRRNIIVTGTPGAGKSEWVDELVLRLCLRHQWKIGFFSPENIPIVYHLRKLIEKLTGHRFQNGCGMTEGLLARSEEFLAENVSHISLKGNATPDRVLAKARELVVRRGCRIFVFDPLNRFDHEPAPGQTETQYISNLLNKFTEFATQYNCLLILVAHPRKMNRNPTTGATPRVEMYDINGSADFYNKADYGIVVERDKEIGITRVYVDKVKFKHLGVGGVATFVYDPVNGRYLPCEESHDPAVPPEQRARNTVYDSSCWLPEKELF
ncbi:toprim domain-containing protein [Bacteroides caccae]|uniref:DnaB-like helicase C-terminal domain-containing protein n=1 Tax=Bacteroides caccae TaxID=47678 RepID=UPI00123100C8|nr:DnaB-like helicase C-terminal domain-containing protein [Bacteroides caccae]KAA5488510.1 toprim domain-containing protein [Bacteroides caccae]